MPRERKRTMKQIERARREKLIAIELMYNDGYSIKEIAKTLETGVQTIHTTLWMMRESENWDVGYRRNRDRL